jgi:hypothetical protein
LPLAAEICPGCRRGDAVGLPSRAVNQVYTSPIIRQQIDLPAHFSAKISPTMRAFAGCSDMRSTRHDRTPNILRCAGQNQVREPMNARLL